MVNKISYDVICLLFSIGCLPLLFLSSLPSTKNWYYCFGVLTLIIIISIFFKKFNINYIVFILIGFLWSTNSAIEYLTSVENYIDQKITIRAIVKSVNISHSQQDNDAQQYVRFQITQINQKQLNGSLPISLLWKDSPTPLAGETWVMKVKTKVAHSYLNEGSFDSQRFAIANRMLLMGTAEEAYLIEEHLDLRQRIVDATLPYINLFDYGDIMLALAYGERSRLTPEHKTLLFQTGIAHLMAISGMHILLVAFLTNRLARGLQFFLPIRLINYWQPLLLGWIAAIFYAWLSGLNPPAMRAIWALSLWLFFRYKNMQLTSWQVINRVITILLILDPLMILSESFWLSCYAVVCLIFISQWFPIKKMNKSRGYIVQLLHLQLLLTVLLLPIQLMIFNGTSGFSIVTNLFAIPVISFITFPAILMMLCMSLLNCFYLTIWFGFIAEQSLSWLFILLEPLSSLWITIPYTFFFLSGIGWLLLIVWRLSLWLRYYITLLVIFGIMLSPIVKDNQQKWQIDMLDVGHGLAMVIRQGNSAILYDTGAKWQTSSAAERIILPFLKWHNLSVEGIIISHEHSDHMGGIDIIKQYYPDAWLLSSTNRLKNDYQCISGNEIYWRSLKLSILWPEKMNDAALNPESCVVRISDDRFSVLLTGDLERQQEERLVLKYGKSLFSTILQIPHHGSNTSSFYAFLSHVNPDISLGSVSRYNPWKLPSNKSLERYQILDLDYYLTRSAGQISIRFYFDSWNLETLRYEIKPRWYHDWFGAFPNYG